jgi:hypothetical protein
LSSGAERIPSTTDGASMFGGQRVEAYGVDESFNVYFFANEDLILSLEAFKVGESCSTR